MKELLIIRHGKTERPREGLRDFDRELQARGISDSKILADHIENYGWKPEAIVSSNAARAIKTAELMAANWELPIADIQVEPSIYLADYSTLLKVIAQLNNQWDRVALFGHNPGFSDLASGLTNEAVWLPTSGTALVRFEVDTWEAAFSDTGKLVKVLTPKEL